MKIIKYIPVVFCLLCAAACFEDESTMDTVRISEITIDTLKIQKYTMSTSTRNCRSRQRTSSARAKRSFRFGTNGT